MKASALSLLRLLAVLLAWQGAGGGEVMEPLKLAGELAARIEGDTDVRAQTLLRVSEASAAAGHFELAEATATSIDDHRRAVALARVARIAAPNLEDHGELRELLNAAKRNALRGNPLAVDHARMELALALATCGEPEKTIADLVALIQDREIKAESALRLSVQKAAKEGAFDGNQAIQQVRAAASAGPFPGAVAAADELLEVAMHRHDLAGTPDERRAALDLVQSALVLAAGANVDFTALQFEAALRLYQAGAEDRSRGVFEQAMKGMNGMPDGYETKAALHAEWARLWVARGMNKEALTIIEKGRALVMQRMEPMHRPAALARLSTVALSAGDTGVADEIMLKALEEAEQNPNPRVRLVAGVDICLAYEASGCAIGDGVERRLRALGGSPSAAHEP